MTTETNWTQVCNKQDLVAQSGICALVEEQQIALFYLPSEESVFAVANFDPFGEANVLSRGLIASKGEDIYVASPLYKQHFCLKTGTCLEDPEKSISAWPARLSGDCVEILI